MELLVLLFLAAVLILVMIVAAIYNGLCWIAGRARLMLYSVATQGFDRPKITAMRTVERDLIELPGPPCPARVRFYHHDFQDRRLQYSEFLGQPSWSGGALRVTTTDWPGALDSFYGGQDIKIGEAAFDRRFVIQSLPPSLALDLLDPPVREQIRRWADWGTGPFLLQLRPRQFLVRVSQRFREGAELRQFIDRCTAFLVRLDGLDTAPVVSAAPLTLGVEAECQVCGAKIDPPKRVLCRKCRTPHHGDCWTYNDGCSVFACGERGSVRG